MKQVPVMTARPQVQVLSSEIFDAIGCVNWIPLNKKTKIKTKTKAWL
jgi:hypothetical protein